MEISLIATVKDASPHVHDFLDSVRSQTRAPDEVVIVDGGSTDGTLEILRGAEGVHVIEAPGANIARGRNLAIGAASHDHIAVSDADCVLDPRWLERLDHALADGADVAMGFYRPLATTVFQAASAAVTLPEAEEVDPDRFMPSSRSIAFRRDVFEKAERYPEWLDIGEDMYLNHRLRELPIRMEFVPEAVAHWRPRPSVTETWRQYFRYAEGDAVAGMYPGRHALRFATYGLLAWGLARRNRAVLALLGAGAAALVGRRARRLPRLQADPADRTRAILSLPAHIALADVAKMAGYLTGGLRRRRRAR